MELSKKERKRRRRAAEREAIAKLRDDAEAMEFADLARTLRERLGRKRFRQDALDLLDVLDKKVGDGLQRRIAANLRRDWETVRTTGGVTGLRSKVSIVAWLLLPPGVGERHVLGRLADFATRNRTVRVEPDRLKYAYSLNPSQIYVGQGGFDGYFVFIYSRTSRVLLENPIEGNAAYVLLRDWKDLSRLTKSELLSSDAAVRVVHSGEWRTHLRSAKWGSDDRRASARGVGASPRE